MAGLREGVGVVQERLDAVGRVEKLLTEGSPEQQQEGLDALDGLLSDLSQLDELGLVDADKESEPAGSSVSNSAGVDVTTTGPNLSQF